MHATDRREVAATPESAPARRRLGRALRFVPLIAITGLIAFFELKPDPSFRSVGSLPPRWAMFLDQRDFFSNAVAFGALGAAAHLAFAARGESRWRVIGRGAALAAVIVALEFSQRFLPRRSCDWYDVFAGWAGLALASLPWFRAGRVTLSHGR